MRILTGTRLRALLTTLLLAGIANMAYAATPSIADNSIVQSAKGKVVLLDFWASWCEPCRKSFPWMNELQRKYGKQGLTVIGVNLDMTRSDADAFLKAIPAQFRIEYDPDGKLASQLNVAAMPTSFLLDRNGKIVKQHAGFRDAQLADREQEIQQLLKAQQ